MTDTFDSDQAKLILNASAFRYDAGLERATNLFDTDREQWNALPQAVKSHSSAYRDLRDHYRAAVAAGAIPDDRTPAV